jgi:hypothetical protein
MGRWLPTRNGVCGAPVTAISQTTDHLDVLVTGGNGIIYTSWWSLGPDWSGKAISGKPSAVKAAAGHF